MSEIIIGKLLSTFYSSPSGDFHLYKARANGGKQFVAVFKGAEPPKARKTVEVIMYGEWIKHPAYGKQLDLARVEPFPGQTQLEQLDIQAKRAVARIIGEARQQ